MSKSKSSEPKPQEMEELVEALEEFSAPPVKAAAPIGTYYVGPTRSELGLTQNTQYQAIPKAAEDNKILRRLFIPIHLYPMAEKQLAAKSGAIYDAYKAAMKEVQE